MLPMLRKVLPLSRTPASCASGLSGASWKGCSKKPVPVVMGTVGSYTLAAPSTPPGVNSSRVRAARMVPRTFSRSWNRRLL